MMTNAAQPQAMISQNAHCDQATHNANGVNRATSPQKVISALRTKLVRAAGHATASLAPSPGGQRVAHAHARGLASMSRHLAIVAQGTRSGQPARTIVLSLGRAVASQAPRGPGAWHRMKMRRRPWGRRRTKHV